MSAPFNDNPKGMHGMKRNLTLDFNQAKKNLNIPTGGSVLSSPDLNLLKVGTPELEKMILANGLTTNTPTPSTVLFPRCVTEEQESFATGFVNALNSLHNNGTGNNQASDNTSGGTVFTELSQSSMDYLPPVIKEEPQTVPNISNTTPPMSPVDMEAQERIKLERKRQRNRLAASKCRTRKLERISRLEDKVKLLKNENTELGTMVNQLKEHVGVLKVEVMDHVHAGCQIMSQF